LTAVRCKIRQLELVVLEKKKGIYDEEGSQEENQNHSGINTTYFDQVSGAVKVRNEANKEHYRTLD